MDIHSRLMEETDEEQGSVYTKRLSNTGCSSMSQQQKNGRGLLNSAQMLLFLPFAVFHKYLLSAYCVQGIFLDNRKSTLNNSLLSQSLNVLILGLHPSFGNNLKSPTKRGKGWWGELGDWD